MLILVFILFLLGYFFLFFYLKLILCVIDFIRQRMDLFNFLMRGFLGCGLNWGSHLFLLCCMCYLWNFYLLFKCCFHFHHLLCSSQTTKEVIGIQVLLRPIWLSVKFARNWRTFSCFFIVFLWRGRWWGMPGLNWLCFYFFWFYFCFWIIDCVFNMRVFLTVVVLGRSGWRGDFFLGRLNFLLG